jgi:hypothetical protein
MKLITTILKDGSTLIGLLVCMFFNLLIYNPIVLFKINTKLGKGRCSECLGHYSMALLDITELNLVSIRDALSTFDAGELRDAWKIDFHKKCPSCNK